MVVAVVSVFTAGSAMLMAWLALTMHSLPMLARRVLATGTVGGLVLAALAAGLARRGVIKRKLDPVRMVNILFVVLVVLGARCENRDLVRKEEEQFDPLADQEFTPLVNSAGSLESAGSRRRIRCHGYSWPF